MTSMIEIGSALPTMVRQPDERTLFLFCAATWNAHRIHYDRDQARAEGHRDLVVQGTLQGGWLAELAVAWAGDPAAVKRLRFRNVGTAYVNEELTISGRVAAVTPRPDGGCDVECDLWVAGPAGVTADGWALISFDDSRHTPAVS